MPGTEAERAVRWFRVSSDKQDERNQVKEVDGHCASRGYQVVDKTFRLHDVSASKGEQEPALQEVLADIRAGAYTVVVIAHSSRLDRRDPDLQQFYALSVRLAGGRIESAREPEFGKASVSGRVVTLLAQDANYQYSKTLAGNVRAAHARIDDGGAFRGAVPWGYATEGPKYAKRLVSTELGRKYIPGIFARVVRGDPLAAVAAWLESEGVPPRGIAKESTPKGKSGQWWPKVIGRMVRNTAYMGYSYHASESGVILHRCEALVDADVFRDAGEALDGHPKKGPTAAENRAMLTGGIFCGNPDCTAGGGGSSPMYRIRPVTTRGGERVTIAYYRCAGRGANRKGCGNMVRLEVADAGMEALALAWFTEPEKRTRIERGHDHKAELAALEYEMRQLSARGLDWEAEDAERARLRAEYKRIADLPAVPDKVITENTGRMYADLWDAVPVNERGKWLADNGLTVCATKEAIWLREDSPAVLSCARVGYSEESHRFSVESVSDGARPIHYYGSEAA